METAHVHSVFPMVIVFSDPAISRSTCVGLPQRAPWDAQQPRGIPGYIRSPLLQRVLSLTPPMRLQKSRLSSCALKKHWWTYTFSDLASRPSPYHKTTLRPPFFALSNEEGILRSSKTFALLPHCFCLLGRLTLQLFTLVDTVDKLLLQAHEFLRRRCLRDASLAHRLDTTPPKAKTCF